MSVRAPFYNRHPWNQWIGMAIVFFLGVTIAGATTPWILLLPLLICGYRSTRRNTARTTSLRQFGYFPGSQHFKYWIYEERHGYADVAIILPIENTEPGHWELYIPQDDLWRQTVPNWAADRRLEIASRVAEGWKAKDFHIRTNAGSA